MTFLTYTENNTALIEAVPTLDTGMCLSVRLLRPIRSISEYVRILFRFPENVEKIRVYFYEPGRDIIGLPLNYWYGQLETMFVR